MYCVTSSLKGTPLFNEWNIFVKFTRLATSGLKKSVSKGILSMCNGLILIIVPSLAVPDTFGVPAATLMMNTPIAR